MISIILATAPGAPPCVLKLLQRQGIAKIAATSWCNREHDAGSAGIMQVPDGMLARACPACQVEIALITPTAPPGSVAT